VVTESSPNTRHTHTVDIKPFFSGGVGYRRLFIKGAINMKGFSEGGQKLVLLKHVVHLLDAPTRVPFPPEDAVCVCVVCACMCVGVCVCMMCLGACARAWAVSALSCASLTRSLTLTLTSQCPSPPTAHPSLP